MSFLIFSGCEGLPFTDEDTRTIEQSNPVDNESEREPDNSQTANDNSPPERDFPVSIEERDGPDNTIRAGSLNFLEEMAPPGNQTREIKISVTDTPNEIEKKAVDAGHDGNSGITTEGTLTEIQPDESSPPDEDSPISEDEISLISEDLDLTEDLVIQNRRVVLDGVTVKTFEHDLHIIADEFVSNQAVIQNFPEWRKAKKKENGKSGGNILIEADSVQGELQLFLNGENGGYVSRGRSVARSKLRGQRGRNGRDAVYQKHCRPVYFLSLMVVDRRCRYRCVSAPTQGQNGEDGQQGLPGFDGKNGGNSGSFRLKAFQLSEFLLTDVQNIPGAGSKGGNGSPGGYGGKRGRNGRDYKDLCNYSLPRTKKGKSGPRGTRGKDGKSGEKGTACIEKLTHWSKASFSGSEATGGLVCY